MPLDSWDPPSPPLSDATTAHEGGIAMPLPNPLVTPEVEPPDPVALAADAAFAELGTKAALNAALIRARAPRYGDVDKAFNAKPEDAADWTPQIVQSGRALHALMGFDDPLVQDARSSYDETAIDLELQAALRQLPALELANGELAALDAFDEALGEGADMEEALSAAIAAAEAAGGKDWTAPSTERSLSPEPDFISGPDTAAQRITEIDNGFELTGDPAPILARDSGGDRRAADPVFQVQVQPEATSPFGGLDPVFGVGFDFGPTVADSSVPLDFERRLLTDRDNARHDLAVTTTVAAASSTDLRGTTAADLLVGGAGKDIIGGLADDDYLYGDTPSNFDSSIHDAASPLTNPGFASSGGDDVMSGGAGADSLWGGAGADQMHGDIPDTGTSLADEFGFGLGAAGFGDDALWGGDGADSLWGGGGNDILYGEAGADSLIGGDGNDILYGGDAVDRLEGNAGVDTLYGQAGADNLFGYAGDDVLVGGEDNDTVAGGAGADEFQFAGGSGADALARAQSLGTDTINDYSAADGDIFGLSDADFGFGAAGNLVAGDTYFESAETTLSATPYDAGGGNAGPAVVVFGANTGTDGVDLYYTDDASAMTNANSYQIADVIGVNMTDVEAGDFFLRS
jgi:hypothetical protein